MRSRFLITIGALIFYRLGMQIPVPGIDLRLLHSVSPYSRGASLAAIFAFGIYPYLEASFIVTILASLLPFLRPTRDSIAGEASLNLYARVGAVCIAAIEAYGVAIALERARVPGGILVSEPGILFQGEAIATMVAGTIVVMWLAEQITRRGIGNGIVLLLLCEMVSRLPTAFTGFLYLARSGALSLTFVLSFTALVIATVWVVVFVERAARIIPIRFARPSVLESARRGVAGELHLKLNMAGIIPIVFASQFLMVPATIVSFHSQPSGSTAWLNLFDLGQPLYFAYYAALIILFAFLYAFFAARPKYLAQRLQKFGGTIADGYAEKPTNRYLTGVVARITLIGSLYLAAICVLPEFLDRFALPFYFGGAVLLITVATALDTVAEFRAALTRR